MSYWDTSCLIKLYTPEHDSDRFREFLASGDVCVTCDNFPQTMIFFGVDPGAGACNLRAR